MCFNPGLTDIKGIGDYSTLMLTQHIIGYVASVLGDAVMVSLRHFPVTFHAHNLSSDISIIRHFHTQENYYVCRYSPATLWIWCATPSKS